MARPRAQQCNAAATGQPTPPHGPAGCGRRFSSRAGSGRRRPCPCSCPCSVRQQLGVTAANWQRNCCRGAGGGAFRGRIPHFSGNCLQQDARKAEQVGLAVELCWEARAGGAVWLSYAELSCGSLPAYMLLALPTFLPQNSITAPNVCPLLPPPPPLLPPPLLPPPLLLLLLLLLPVLQWPSQARRPNCAAAPRGRWLCGAAASAGAARGR
jgi:hypothetical protein